MNIPEKYLIKDPSLLVAGQKLWSALHGEVEIVEILLFNNNPSPIRVKNSKGVHSQYTKKGKYIEDDLLPTLFLSCPYEVNEFPKVMEVWNDGVRKINRVVFYKDKTGYYAHSKITTLEECDTINKNTDIFIWQYARDITPVMPEVDEQTKNTIEAIVALEKELEKLKGSLNK